MSITAAVDTRQATIKLASVNPRVVTAVKATVAKDTVQLWNIVRLKVTDDVLHVRSGNLRRSIQQDISDTDSGSTGRIFSDGSVPYARIQEYGGRIEIPEISGKLMVFQYQGKTIFTMKTKAHTVDIPPRSYMRSSLWEFAPKFESDVAAAVAAAAL